MRIYMDSDGHTHQSIETQNIYWIFCCFCKKKLSFDKDKNMCDEWGLIYALEKQADCLGISSHTHAHNWEIKQNLVS